MKGLSKEFRMLKVLTFKPTGEAFNKNMKNYNTLWSEALH